MAELLRNYSATPARRAVAGAKPRRCRNRASVVARCRVVIAVLLAVAIAAVMTAHRLAGSGDFSPARVCSETCAPSASPPLPQSEHDTTPYAPRQQRPDHQRKHRS